MGVSGSHAGIAARLDVDGSDERFWQYANESVVHVVFVVVVENGTTCVVPSARDECQGHSVVEAAKDSTTLSKPIELIVPYV